MEQKEYNTKEEYNKLINNIKNNNQNIAEILDISYDYLITKIKKIQKSYFESKTNTLNNTINNPTDNNIQSNTPKQYIPLSFRDKQDIILKLSNKESISNNLALIKVMKQPLINTETNNELKKNTSKSYTLNRTIPSHLYTDNIKIKISTKRKEVFQNYPPNPELKLKEKLYGKQLRLELKPKQPKKEQKKVVKKINKY